MSEYYKELLKRPEWDEKRIHILKRDGFKCVECGKSNVELQVHHKKYIKGRMPWNYSDRHLVTLCDPCHDTVHVIEKADNPVIKKKSHFPPKKSKKKLIQVNKYKKQKFKEMTWGKD